MLFLWLMHCGGGVGVAGAPFVHAVTGMAAAEQVHCYCVQMILVWQSLLVRLVWAMSGNSCSLRSPRALCLCLLLLYSQLPSSQKRRCSVACIQTAGGLLLTALCRAVQANSVWTDMSPRIDTTVAVTPQAAAIWVSVYSNMLTLVHNAAQAPALIYVSTDRWAGSWLSSISSA